MSVDDTRQTSVEASNSTAAAAVSSLLTDDVASGDDHATRVDRSSKLHSVHIREPPVSETRQPTTSGQQTAVWSEQKHGPLHRAIPSMPLPLAIIACILNIILPGTGTLLSAFSVFCCGTTTRISRPVVACLLNVLSALLQLATFLLIVGWVWSITWGMAFVQLAYEQRGYEMTIKLRGVPVDIV